MTEVHICQVGDWLFVALPSEKRAFRKEIAKMAVPFVAFPKGPKYRMPADLRAPFFDLVIRHYPNWRIREWGFREWNDIPPWVREGVEQMLAQATEGSVTLQQVLREFERGG